MHKGKISIGFYPMNMSSILYTFALDAAGDYFALSFVPDASKTLNKITLYTTAVAGTLGANDLVADLYSDTNGSPGTLIQSRNTVTAVPTGAGRVEFTGFTSAVTGGTRYWLVFKNVNATPATNYITYRYLADYTGPYDMGSFGDWGWTKIHSIDSGATWANKYYCQPILRLEYSDATFEGLPVDTIANTDVSTASVYSARESGNRFTSPNVILNVVGVSFYVYKGGTPTGNLRYRIYNVANLMGTTNSIPVGNVSSGGWRFALFPSNVLIFPLTDLRVVMSETAQADTSSNRYYGSKYDFENTANTLNLKPFNGTIKRTYYNGTSWADTDTDVVVFMLLLDPDRPFLNNRFNIKSISR